MNKMKNDLERAWYQLSYVIKFLHVVGFPRSYHTLVLLFSYFPYLRPFISSHIILHCLAAKCDVEKSWRRLLGSDFLSLPWTWNWKPFLNDQSSPFEWNSAYLPDQFSFLCSSLDYLHDYGSVHLIALMHSCTRCCFLPLQVLVSAFNTWMRSDSWSAELQSGSSNHKQMLPSESSRPEQMLPDSPEERDRRVLTLYGLDKQGENRCWGWNIRNVGGYTACDMMEWLNWSVF